jgi:hypothetical protein
MSDQQSHRPHDPRDGPNNTARKRRRPQPAGSVWVIAVSLIGLLVYTLYLLSRVWNTVSAISVAAASGLLFALAVFLWRHFRKETFLDFGQLLNALAERMLTLARWCQRIAGPDPPVSSRPTRRRASRPQNRTSTSSILIYAALISAAVSLSVVFLWFSDPAPTKPAPPAHANLADRALFASSPTLPPKTIDAPQIFFELAFLLSGYRVLTRFGTPTDQPDNNKLTGPQPIAQIRKDTVPKRKPTQPRRTQPKNTEPNPNWNPADPILTYQPRCPPIFPPFLCPGWNSDLSQPYGRNGR